MNPSAISAEPQPEIPIWCPGGCTIYSGLDSGHISQTGHFGLDCDVATITDPLAPTRFAAVQEADYKPNGLMTDAIATGLRQFDGVLPNNIVSNSLTESSWGAQNLGAADVNGPPHNFYSASVHCVGSVGRSESVGFPRGSIGYVDTRSGSHQHQNPLLGLINWDQRRVHDIVKREFCIPADFASTLGLNLNQKTYLPIEDNAMATLYKRFRPNSPGVQVPTCQSEGCKADLRMAKHYHRRHKVCEFHSKAASVMIGGQTQRFCQQCSRFHVLSEFDEGKRSCRKRLADHNRRRRKPQPVSTSTNGDSATELTLQKSDVSEHNTSGIQAKTTPNSQAQMGSSVSTSLPSSILETLQNANCKRLTSLLPQNPKKEVPNDISRAAPSLSLSTFDEDAVKRATCQRQSSVQSLTQLDLPINCWRSNANSSSSRSMDVGTTTIINDGRCPNKRLLPPLSYTTQNLLPLPVAREHISESSHCIVESMPGHCASVHKNHDMQPTSESGEAVLNFFEFRAKRADLFRVSRGATWADNC